MKLNIKSEQAAGAVAGAAFIASAGHIMTVVSASNPWFVSPVYAIGIDGLLYVGIRAVQTGRRLAGILAILVGSFFSLAFNAHAEGALVMPKLMIAASMPVCMVVAFVIEGTAKKAKEIVAPAATPQIITKTVAPALLPIVPFVKPTPAPASRWVGAGARHTLRIVPLTAPKPVAKPKTIPTPAASTPAAPKAKTITGAGRVAAWDVEKAVRLLADGRTDVDVLDMVDGLTAKPLQRTKRAIKIMQEDASTTDETIAGIVGQSSTHIARVRAALNGEK